MIKNNVFMKHCKRTLSVVLAAVVMITLSGCGSTADKNPIGGIDANASYSSSGSYNLSVGELYTELKHNALGYLTQEIENATLKDYLEKVTFTGDDKEKQENLVAEYILEDIYGTSDEDDIADMKQSDRELYVEKYVDAMFLEGHYITFEKMNEKLTVEQMLNCDFFDYLKENEYKIDVAKYLYAYDCLTEEIKETDEAAAEDEDLDKYFTDREIANYYDSNYKYEDTVDAVIIRFLNQTEANNVLRKFGIKTYNGEWFLIQPPKDEYGNIDYSKWKNESDYNKYYDDYTINQTNAEGADIPIKAASNSDTAILKLYIEMYNYIYTYRTTLTYDGQEDVQVESGVANYMKYYQLTSNIISYESDPTITNKVSYESLVSKLVSDNSSFLTFDKEKLDTYSTSLTTYVHDTLSTKAEIDEDTGEELSFTQYTASSRSYNNNYYLIFKLRDAVEREFYEIVEDEDTGEDVYDFKLKDENGNTNEANQKIYDEILEKMFEDELTSSYISAKFNEKMEFISIEIYDSTVEFYYSQSNSDYKNTKKSSDTLVALITYKDKDNSDEWTWEVSVKDTYEFLETVYGTQTSVALLFNKYIVTTDYYKDLDNDEDYQTYKDGIYYTLTNFANDAYSSYGYPASIGKYNFMENYYRSSVIDEAIEYLMVQDAKRAFFLENTTTTEFYEAMLGYADTAYDNYYSLTLTNILVYVDMDEDGVADVDWFTTDDEGAPNSSNEFIMTKEEKVALANELIAELIKYAKTSTNSLATSFAEVVAEYNSSSRIEVDADADDKLSGNVEVTWAKYRKHGLYISTNSLGEFTDTTTNDETLQTLVENLYNDDTNEIIFNNSFSGSYLLTDSKDYVITEDGMNLLLVTGGNGKTEIDFENEDEDLYKGVPIRIEDSYKLFDLASTGLTANLTQTEVYCREYFVNGSSTSLPTGANSYLSTYLNPVLTKYNSEVVQIMLMMEVLDNLSITNDTDLSRLNSHITYLQKVSDNYLDTSAGSTSNFAGFWTDTAFFKGGAQ